METTQIQWQLTHFFLLNRRLTNEPNNVQGMNDVFCLNHNKPFKDEDEDTRKTINRKSRFHQRHCEWAVWGDVSVTHLRAFCFVNSRFNGIRPDCGWIIYNFLFEAVAVVTAVSVGCSVGAAIDSFREGLGVGGDREGCSVPEPSDRWRGEARHLKLGEVCDFQLFASGSLWRRQMSL